MSLPYFADDTIVVLRAPLAAVDRYNRRERDWAHATETTYTGCLVQPQSGSEDTAQGDTVTHRMRLFAEAGIDIEATDRVRFDGQTYAVDGPPSRFATGVLDHIEASLELVREE